MWPLTPGQVRTRKRARAGIRGVRGCTLRAARALATKYGEAIDQMPAAGGLVARERDEIMYAIADVVRSHRQGRPS